MARRWAALSLACSLLGATLAAAPPLTAPAVLQRIKKDGAGPTLDRLYASEAAWSQVLRGVRTGSAGWVEVARALKAQGGPSAPELTAALSEALAVAPERVLGALGKEFDADDVCSLNTLEDTLGESYAAAVSKVKARRKAVGAVKATSLGSPRDECLGFLEELEREVERNRTEWFPKP
jgi:hypothetical protein